MTRFIVILLLAFTIMAPALAQYVPSIMNLSAHPDDEDGSTLAYYRYKYGVKTYSICFTRGEGGQNEVGPELYENLGVLRTAETENAARIIGSEVYFLNFVDFGFSKSAKETFDIWGKDNAIARLVYMIRKLKPDILFTNHDTTTGHGNHQAVAIAALQAFWLAADPSYHAEQLKEPGIALFQPKKMFMRIFLQRDSLLKPDVVNPVSSDTLALGKTAARLAMEALAQHRTQGMDKAVASGRFGRFLDSTRYILVRSNEVHTNVRNDFFGGLQRADARLLPLIPSKSPLQFSLSDSIVVPNQKFRIDVTPLESITNLTLSLELPSGWTSKKLDAPGKEEFEIVVSASPRYTYPRVRHLYETMRTLPLITINAAFDRGERHVREAVPVYMDVAPLQAISLSSQIFRITDEPLKIPFAVRNYFPKKAAGRVRATVPKGWDVLNSEFVIAKEDSVYNDTVTIMAPRSLAEGTYPVSIAIDADTARVTLKKFNTEVAAGLKIGIVQSYDDVFSDVLHGLEVDHRSLTEKDLFSGDLQLYSAIVIDIRAYLVRQDLVKNNGRILDYVKNGGTLIVMYQREQEWKPDFAPYPFSLSRNRVTYETAPVHILKQDHALFNVPNKIDSTAWDDWVQERAVYLPSNVPAQYERLLSSADPDESQLDTGLLYAKYGRGQYLYSSYVWYRELKEVNKGAFRMFANMVSIASGR